MRIGLYKPNKKIFFYDNLEDHASWSPEIVNIAKMFASKGDMVYILSETDYLDGISNVTTEEPEDPLDKIFIFNGMWTNEEERATLKMLRVYSSSLNYIISDLRLPTYNASLYEKIFTQSRRLHTYGFIQEATLIDAELTQANEKWISYYFGGTERGRKKDFFEYVYRPDCVWFGKSETLDVKDYIPHYRHLKNLQAAKTTIIIADELYNDIGFVNDRFYECAKFGVVCFADSKWDPDELILKKDDWRRVRNYPELFAKQQVVLKDEVFRNRLVEEQYEMIKDKLTGLNIYLTLTK